MLSRTKTLGLVLSAAFAMGAMAASAAYATEEGQVLGENEAGSHVTTFVTGEDKVGQGLVFEPTGGGSQITCANNEFHGIITGGTAKSVTLEPTYIGPCSAGAFPQTVHRNNCHYTFDTFETSGSHSWKVKTAVTCPEGSPGIQTTVHAGSPHAAGNRICTITIPPQTGINGVTLHSNTEGEHDDLTVTFEATGITRTQLGLCGHQHGTATLTGGVTLEGTDIEESPVNLYVDHDEEHEAKTIHEAETEISLHGQSAGHALTAGEVEVECSTSTLAATTTETTIDVTDEVTFKPTYTSCIGESFPATVFTNNCHYLLHDLESTESGDYEAPLDLVCPEGVEGIQIKIYTAVGHATMICDIMILEQANLGPVTVSNNEATTDVSLAGGIEDVEYKQSGFCGKLEGTAEYDLPSTTITGSKAFHASEISLHGQSSGHALTAGEIEVECSTSTLAATIAETTIGVTDEVTFKPTYSGSCTGASLPTTVFTNNCHYLLHDLKSTESGDYEAPIDIACPEGVEGIQIKIYTTVGHAVVICDIMILEQANLGPVTVSNNEATTDVSLAGGIEDVEYKQSGFCGKLEGTAEYDLPSTTITGSEAFHAS